MFYFCPSNLTNNITDKYNYMTDKSHRQLRIQTVNLIQTILQYLDILTQTFSLLGYVFLLQEKVLELIFNVEVAD